MSATAGDNYATNGAAATAARLAGSLIDAVLQLKEAPYAFRIHIVRDRRSPEPNGMLQDVPQRKAQVLKFDSCQPSRAPSWPNACMKEAFVCIDIPHSGKESLIEQGGLDRQLPPAKECGEPAGIDRERLST
jgi:hypothetical protein